MLYRIQAGAREWYLVRSSLESVKRVAWEKRQHLAVGESVLIFCGGKLVATGPTRLGLFDETEAERFGIPSDSK
jgi:hypothetical protein